MNNSHAKWKHLPVEIIHKIFRESPSRQSCEYALVCKAWKHPAQAVLYANIRIKTLSQLKKFHNTVKCSPQLGEMVKSFNSCIGSHQFGKDTRITTLEEILNLLPDLLSTHLPNLEEFNEHNISSYTPILNALLESRLKNLKRLNICTFSIDKTELANYATCAFLLRDRLENMTISDSFFSTEQQIEEKLYLSRLYNKLHLFDKLSDLEITRRTNDEIRVLEYVVESCKSLKKIDFTFDFSSRDNNVSLPNNDVSIDSISNYTPRTDIKTLTTVMNVSSDYKLLLYVMHKFPQLQKLTLRMKGTSLAKLNQHIFVQLLHYKSKICLYSLNNLAVDEDIIAETIRNYWGAESKPGNECVMIDYSDHPSPVLDILKESHVAKPITRFKYPIPAFEWKHIDFIEKNGKFIEELHFGFTVDEYPSMGRCILPENFVAHTFSNCTNIRYLTLDTCVLKRSDYAAIDLSRKFSLFELFLDNCLLYAGMLEQLSLIIRDTRELRLSGLSYRTSEDSPDVFLSSESSYLEIIMPHTKIDIVTIDEEIYRQSTLYLKVFAVTREQFHYFQLDPSGDIHLKVSNEQEYAIVNGNKHIYICCQTIPHFQFSQ